MGTVDFQQLEERFNLTLTEVENTVLTLPALNLLKEDIMLHFLDTYGPLIKSTERSVTAAFFLSWYAGVCSARQYMLFRGDEVLLDLALSNVSIQLYMGDHYSLFSFKMNEAKLTKVPVVDRDAWLKKSLHDFYSEEVTPLVEAFSQLNQMSAHPLWGQIANSLYDQLEEEMAKASDEASRKRILYHFDMLKGVSGSAFGLRRNPFNIKQKFIEHQSNPDQTMLMKTACCLAYRLDMEFGYCYACPRLKETNRALMRVSSCC